MIQSSVDRLHQKIFIDHEVKKLVRPHSHNHQLIGFCAGKQFAISHQSLLVQRCSFRHFIPCRCFFVRHSLDDLFVWRHGFFDSKFILFSPPLPPSPTFSTKHSNRNTVIFHRKLHFYSSISSTVIFPLLLTISLAASLAWILALRRYVKVFFVHWQVMILVHFMDLHHIHTNCIAFLIYICSSHCISAGFCGASITSLLVFSLLQLSIIVEKATSSVCRGVADGHRVFRRCCCQASFYCQ